MPDKQIVSTDQYNATIAHWQRRSDSLAAEGFKKAKLKAARVEFFAGAMSALDAVGYVIPPYWVIAIQTGREIEPIA